MAKERRNPCCPGGLDEKPERLGDELHRGPQLIVVHQHDLVDQRRDPCKRLGHAELRKLAELPTKGSGLFLYIKVDDVEGFHKAVLSKGMKPDGEPQARPSGNREFLLRDPDGYNLAFFQKK